MCQAADWVPSCSCKRGKADRHGGGVVNRHHRAQEDVPDNPCVDADVLANDSSYAPGALRGQRDQRRNFEGQAKQLTPFAVRPRLMSGWSRSVRRPVLRYACLLASERELTLLRDSVFDAAKLELSHESRVAVVTVVTVLERLRRRDLRKELVRLGRRGLSSWRVSMLNGGNIRARKNKSHNNERRASAAAAKGISDALR